MSMNKFWDWVFSFWAIQKRVGDVLHREKEKARSKIRFSGVFISKDLKIGTIKRYQGYNTDIAIISPINTISYERFCLSDEQHEKLIAEVCKLNNAIVLEKETVEVIKE